MGVGGTGVGVGGTGMGVAAGGSVGAGGGVSLAPQATNKVVMTKIVIRHPTKKPCTKSGQIYHVYKEGV